MPRSWFDDEVAPRLTVDDVFSPHLKWSKQVGRSWRAACPIHGGKNPDSLAVDPERLVYQCHSCGASGGPVHFLYQLDAGPDAGTPTGKDAFRIMAELGRRIGIEPDKDTPEYAPPKREVAEPAPPSYPPPSEVFRLWREARLVSKAAAWTLESWGVDAAKVDEEIRCLHPLERIPSWARTCGQVWGRDAYELLFPLRDAGMRPVSFVARSLSGLSDPKSGCPAGHTTKGLVFANKTARDAVLRKVIVDRIVVREGERDWLFDAQHGHAVIGTRSGAWSDEMTKALPDAVGLVIATDPDPKGDRLFGEIVDSISRLRRTDIRWSRAVREDAA